MEFENLKELMGLLKDTDITELQVEKEGVKVKIKREKFFGRFEIQKPVVHEKEAIKEEAAEPEAEDKLVTITSPIVGTFYRAASPEAEPFVNVGARVKKGQVICIIEAMKLMNEIESEADGVIARILVENGHPVEYGEPLFLVEPIG
ncbi:MAG: acetyl-CoA carboxylase, biotin carboxyl carrier protein [Nitrospirae bacterium GWC2_46_6]|nr:MAG: acetyl-CoA carboxylase, biotin carboxyl carrier protein [Nitrospirae bacterium GWC2_46_6]HAK89824.1 acetyl-CoA carboxylase, biotin carboxyl carrier protein [Nitrospiraceae bacterium]HCL81542.1 acetyl-CoA carboxylase, biotin carboxyl carrier protein [Nitrospiraceae bacterium]